jgi:tmRNA-binding protein
VAESIGIQWLIASEYTLGVLLAYYSWKQLKKGSIKIRNTFAEASKEVKYEESCLCGSYSHNGHLSHKPIAQ